MSQHPADGLPKDHVTVIPDAVRIAYTRTNDGLDLVYLYTDGQLGPLSVVLPAEQALSVGLSLLNMVHNLPELRAEWATTAGGEA